MSLCLSPKDVEELTDRYTRPAQQRRLRAMGIPFILDDETGRIKVLRAVVEKKGGYTPERQDEPAAPVAQPERVVTRLERAVVDAAKIWLVRYEDEVRDPSEEAPCKDLVAALDTLAAAPVAQPDAEEVRKALIFLRRMVGKPTISESDASHILRVDALLARLTGKGDGRE